MGKKGTKRRTQWRTLSITECPQEHSKNGNTKKYAASNSNNTTDTNIDEAISLDDDFNSNKYSTSNHPQYLKRKSSTLNSLPNFNNKNDYRNSSSSRNNHSYNYNKQNSTSSTSSLYSSRFSYRRRPYSLQNGSSKYYSSYGAERTTSRGHRNISEPRDKDNSTKPLFNEDDYTRITTPRQDVIFKKGYFSQPKKYLSSTDTNTTSSATASVVSVEESMSATSVPSLSPEQCSSQADSLDPEQGFVYSFIDPNGVVYSYVPNGFDQFNGQIMMLPYGYPPYNMCSPDINSPTGSNDDSDQNRTSVDSNQISDDVIEKTEENEDPVVPQDDKDSTSMPESTEITTEKDNKNSDIEKESDEKTVEDESKDAAESSELIQNAAGQYFGYQPCYPHMVYPYLFPQQFMPVFGNDYDASNEMCDEDLERQNRVRYRCRKIDNVDGNSTGATTTDYSEDELSEQDDSTEIAGDSAPNQHQDQAEEGSTQTKETEQIQLTLNTNVKEFVPRATLKSNLNVNVKEFLPRNYKSQDEQQKQNVDVTAPRLSSSLEKFKKESILSKQLNTDAVIADEIVQKKPNELTLAEKIKQRLAEELKSVTQKKITVQKSPPQRKALKKTDPKKSEILPEQKSISKNKVQKIRLPQSPVRNQLSYAQIANKSKIEAEKVSNTISIKEDQPLEMKIERSTEVEAVKVTDQVANIATNQTTDLIVDSWKTVKSRGKRSKHFKEFVVDEEPNEEITPEEEPEQQQRPVQSAIDLVDPIEPKNEMQSIEIEDTPADEITTPQSSQKKKPTKSRSRKTSKKSPALNKKTNKKLELIEPNFEIPKKTEKHLNGNSTHEHAISENFLEEEDNIEEVNENDDDDDPETPPQSEANLTFDRMYLGKGFGRSPMDILKGFDYKYKNKSILREEEEMVLSVIKSLNNSGLEKKSDATMSLMMDDDDDEKTVIESCDNKNGAQDGGSETDTVSELSMEEETTMIVGECGCTDTEPETSLCNGIGEHVDEFCIENTENIDILEEQSAEVNDGENIICNGNNYQETINTKEVEEKVANVVKDIESSTIDIQYKNFEENDQNDSTGFNTDGSQPLLQNGVSNSLDQKNTNDDILPKLTNGFKDNRQIPENGHSEHELKSEDLLESYSSKLSQVNIFSDGSDGANEKLVRTKEESMLEETVERITNDNLKLEEINHESFTNQTYILSDKNDQFELDQDFPDATNTVNKPDEHFCTILSGKSKLKTEMHNLNSVNSENQVAHDGSNSPDYAACVEVLSGLIKTGLNSQEESKPELSAISEGWKLIMANETPVKFNGVSSNGHVETEDSLYRPTDHSDKSQDVNNFMQSELNEEIKNRNNQKENESRTELNESIMSRVPNGHDGLTERIENTFEDQLRTFNTGISCDHSSGIGSDCDENHPEDFQSYLSIQSQGVEERKSSSCAPTTSVFPESPNQSIENTLPNNHRIIETNSVCCDTQFVSYTSKKLTGPHPIVSSNEAKGGTAFLDNVPKFPNRTESATEDPKRFPLTEAVKLWLSEETKEPTPEPILRLPDNPDFKSRIQQKLQSVEIADGWSTTDESENENDDSCFNAKTNPKNLKSNPLHVSSVNIDNNDSDYNSDSNQQRYDNHDERTCERVAKILSDNQSIIQDKCDLLDYWDDEFISNPKKWLIPSTTTSRSTSMGHDESTSGEQQFEPYESLYGTTINYNQLLASNFEFLSNNILSFNNDNNANKILNNNYTETNNHKNDTLLNNKNNNNNINNFDNDIHRNTITNTTSTTHNTHTNNNENFVKPPEICCILM